MSILECLQRSKFSEIQQFFGKIGFFLCVRDVTVMRALRVYCCSHRGRQFTVLPRISRELGTKEKIPSVRISENVRICV